MKIGLFLDCDNLYTAYRSVYGKGIDYSKLLAFLEPLGELEQKNCYILNLDGKADGFCAAMRCLGFKVHEWCKLTTPQTKSRVLYQHNPLVQMTLDVLEAEGLDTIILGTNNSYIRPLISRINAKVAWVHTRFSNWQKNTIKMPPSVALEAK